jgi:L-fucose isomerase-like protein
MGAILVPFAYPGYPAEIYGERIEQSKRFLRETGIDFTSAETVVTLEDCLRVVQMLKSESFDYAIFLIATWIEAPNAGAVLDAVRHKPVMLWSHANIYGDPSGDVLSLGSIAAAAVLRESFEELGANFRFVVGNPCDEKTGRELFAFHRAASAAAALRGKRLGMFGYASMGMYTGLADHIKVKRAFGTEIVQADQYSILNRMQKAGAEALAAVKARLKEQWEIGPGIGEDLLDNTAAVYLALKDIVNEQKLDSVTVKCQYELSVEYGFTPCVPLSLLGGEMPVSCEGDVYLLLSQMILSGLSGETSTYGDILEFLDDGVIMAACGYAPKCFLRPERPCIQKHTALYSGLLITSPFREGPVTVVRLANRGEGFKMHILKGRAEELKNFHETGCPQYAGAVIRFENKDMERFKQEVMSQHYAVAFGDWAAEAEAFCRIMKIDIE